MKTKKILLCLIALLFFGIRSNAQLTSSLNFSTGFNNATATVIPVGQPDPNWIVVALTNPPFAGTPPYPAFVQNPWGSPYPTPYPTTATGTRWISYGPTSMTNGQWDSAGGMMTLRFDFETCLDDTIKFTAAIRVDNRVSAIRIDGVATGFTIPASNPSTWTTPANFVYNTFLPAGAHNVQIDVHNTIATLSMNPVGINLSGTITGHINSIVNRDSFPNYVCAGCDDSCYWSVSGNTIQNAKNYFGTNSNDAIKIRSNAINRGIITPGSSTTGGYFGWNTLTPTARLHVNCANGNTGSLSDIRFEGLETGDGSLLAINSQGYVFNTNKTPLNSADFWNVLGNSVTATTNIFGTNNNNPVQLRTNGVSRGILTAGTSGTDDGRLGWQTLSPTAHLHINCSGGNPDDGSQGSDIRFEKLEKGRGNVLVIDEAGYVYDSGRRLAEGQGPVQRPERIDELEKEVADLKTQLQMLLNTKDVKQSSVNDGSRLYQNTPNPFSKETTIQYYVHGFKDFAYITVNDLNGRRLLNYPVKVKGDGSVVITGQSLVPGMYLYSLIIDGVEADTKKMVVE